MQQYSKLIEFKVNIYIAKYFSGRYSLYISVFNHEERSEFKSWVQTERVYLTNLTMHLVDKEEGSFTWSEDYLTNIQYVCIWLRFCVMAFYLTQIYFYYFTFTKQVTDIILHVFYHIVLLSTIISLNFSLEKYCCIYLIRKRMFLNKELYERRRYVNGRILRCNCNIL